MLVVHEKHSKIGAARSKNSLVCLEIYVVNSNAAVTEKTPFSLVVQLLEDIAAVVRSRHLGLTLESCFASSLLSVSVSKEPL